MLYVGIPILSLFVVYYGIVTYLQMPNESQMRKEWNLDDYSMDDCFWVKKDTNGYLEKICKYIIKNKLSGASDPTKYNILHTQEQEYKGKEVIAVFLDCCHIGDVAYIDKETKDVIKFHLGPM